MFMYVILTIVICLAIANKMYYPILRGAVGEWRLANRLQAMNPEFIVINDLYIPKDDGSTAQIDHLVLTPYGIFVMEMKNYQGWIFGSEKKRNWTQVIFKKKSSFLNPIMQNEGHLKALKAYLKKEYPYHSVIVFSDQATLKLQGSFTMAHVVQMKHVKRLLKQFTVRLIEQEELEEIKEQLVVLKPKTYGEKRNLNKQHIAHIKNKQTITKKSTTIKIDEQVEKSSIKMKRIEPKEKEIEVLNCPKCGNALREREGKYGKFIGCSNFPQCKFTTNKPATIHK